MKTITKTKLDQLTYEIIGAAIEMHRQLGPGLLESIYHERMKIELKSVKRLEPIFEAQVNDLNEIIRCPERSAYQLQRYEYF